MSAACRKSRDQRDDEPEPDGQRRQPALGRDLQRHVVQVRIQLVDGALVAVVRIDLDDHVGPDAGQRIVLDDAEPDCIIATRSTFDGSGQAERRVEPRRAGSAGANARNSASATGSSASSRKSRSRNSRPIPTHAPTQALRVNVKPSASDQRRQHQRRPRRGGASRTSRARPPRTPPASAAPSRSCSSPSAPCGRRRGGRSSGSGTGRCPTSR